METYADKDRSKSLKRYRLHRGVKKKYFRWLTFPFLFFFGANLGKPSAQYGLAALRRDGGSLTVAAVSHAQALGLIIDLHGHATDKTSEAI